MVYWLADVYLEAPVAIGILTMVNIIKSVDIVSSKSQVDTAI